MSRQTLCFCQLYSWLKCSAGAGLQLPGVLDELFFYDGPLGAHVSDDGTSIGVWAPTAQQVEHPPCRSTSCQLREP